MTILACQNYVVTTIQGVEGAYGGTGLEAWVDPPVGGIASLETPQAQVLAAELAGTRQTMAALAGFYNDVHQIYVYLQWAMPPNAVNANSAFINLVDTVIQTIRESYTGAVTITDPATGFESQLLVIGDKLSNRLLPPRTIDDAGEGWLVYGDQITFEVKEKVQQYS